MSTVYRELEHWELKGQGGVGIPHEGGMDYGNPITEQLENVPLDPSTAGVPISGATSMVHNVGIIFFFRLIFLLIACFF